MAACGKKRVIVGGDLNGHTGRSRDGIERIHGGWRMRDRNDEGGKDSGHGNGFRFSYS